MYIILIDVYSICAGVHNTCTCTCAHYKYFYLYVYDYDLSSHFLSSCQMFVTLYYDEYM